MMHIVVIGAGAAGLVAAAEASAHGADVLLLEKNRKIGVKILMSGGTRCNLTHDTDARGITDAFGHAKRFLQPSVGAFPPEAVVRMFESLGVATKVEATGKIFPGSNRALEVRDALHRRAVEAGVEIRTESGVVGLRRDGSRWRIATDDGPVEADRVIITAGGKSYPGCGTTGDAYAWLQKLGHTIVRPRPALVPLVGGVDWTHELSGVTLEDCVAKVCATTTSTTKQRPLIERRAPWLFTHFGFSGPAAMDVSGVITAAESIDDVRLFVDLLPDVTESELREWLTVRTDGGRRKVSAVLSEQLPNRLADALIQRSGGNRTVAELPRRSLQRLIEHCKRLELPVTGTRGFPKAEVTAGGVLLGEVDPRTMASRVADGLYVAGEVLDVDGPIGGYNFQAAFSSGRAAGIAAAMP